MCEKEDFEERAAIREFDGDQPRGTADFFAREEIGVRKAKYNATARREQCQKNLQQQTKQPQTSPPAINSQCRQQIQALREKRDAIGNKMRAEKNAALKDKLFDEWMGLNGQIIELRKDVKK